MDFKLSKSNMYLKVYTVPEVPATGAEDGLAIISSVPMTNWVLSPDEPAGAPRTVGDVWIRYAVTGDPFNILKQNAMVIDPIAAWQYVDGAWVDVEMRRYLDGARLALWNGELYSYGEEYAGVTGGWVTDGYTISDGSVMSVEPGQKNSDHFVLSGTNTTKVMFGTNNPINVDKFTTLHVEGEPTSASGGRSISFAVYRDKAQTDCLADFNFGTDYTRSVETLDLSNVTGDVYVVVSAQFSLLSAGKIHRVWLS